MIKRLLLFVFIYLSFIFPVFSTNQTIDFESPGGYTVTSGTFTRVTTEKHEGTYSIESGNNTNNSTSCFEISNNLAQDGDIEFYYKVSSESGYDFLRFYIDGTEQNRWAGEVSWTQASYPLTAGNHTFRWCYTKDVSISNGQDKAWVDLIEITEDIPPQSVPILDFETPGGYTITTNAVSGDDWIRVSTEKYEGTYSLESQNRSDNTTSCFERTENIPANAISVEFYYKVSSEASYDFLRFYIDGTEQNSWAGEIPWTKASYPITAGNHTFRWCYTKDVSISNGQDRAWVDSFSVLVPGSSITLTEITAVPTPTNDSTPNYTFSSSTAGSLSYSGSCSSATTTAVSGNNTITFNTLSDGNYSDCKLKVDTSDWLDISSFQVDTTIPTITYNFPSTNNFLMPNSDFTLDVSYNDNLSGIDTSTVTLFMQKWNGSSWGSNISGTYATNQTLTQTGATYDISKPGFGRYRFRLRARDLAGNTRTLRRIVYLDEPEMIINSSELDLGVLNPNSLEFSDDEIIVTIKTIGASFELGISKDTNFSNGTNIIIDWDGAEGVGYDKSPYTSSNKHINNNQILQTQVKNINTSGERNTYTFPIKIGTFIKKEQAAGEYEMDLGFNIRFSY